LPPLPAARQAGAVILREIRTMSIPIHANQGLSSLAGMFAAQSPRISSGTSTIPGGTFGQLVSALEQTGSSSAVATSSSNSISEPASGASVPGTSQGSAMLQSLFQTLEQGTGATPAQTEVGASTTPSVPGTTDAANGSTRAPGHHHGHHHGGDSSWLTNLLDDNSTSTTSTVTATNSSSSSSGTAAYASQLLAQPLVTSLASTATPNLLAIA
jgi:hypothetical protein